MATLLANTLNTSGMQHRKQNQPAVNYEPFCEECYDDVIQMDLYFLAGNALHLISLLYLLAKLLKAKSCEGVSGKTQLLFFIAYVTRYMDVLLAYYSSAFSTIGKLTYIALHFITVFLIFIGFEKSYKWTEDTFLTEALLWASVIMAIWFNNDISRQEVSYAFSMFLEALAILPQFHVIRKSREVERSLLYYLMLLGLDRLAYLINWLYRFLTENYVDTMSKTTGYLHLTMCLVASHLFFVLGVRVANGESDKYLRSNIHIV